MAASGNIVVENQGLNPLVSYNYMLRVEGVFDLPCKSVHSFTKENEYEFIQEGGLNDYVHMRRKPVTKPFTFTVERYVGIDYYDPLQNGSELILPVILLVTRHANRFDVTKRAYVFTGCTVMSKEYGELNAEQSGLLTETTVIGYREMLVVNAADQEIGTWSFDGTKADGSGPRFAKTYTTPEIEAEEGKNEPSLWKFNEKKPAGNGKQRAAKDVSKPAGEPRLWSLNGQKPEGNGTRSARLYTPPETEIEEPGNESKQPKRWEFDEKKPAGNGKQYASKDVSTEAEDARLWEFDKHETEGNKVRSARTEKAKPAVGRKWPAASSAKKRSAEQPEEQTGRKWPTVSSAKKRATDQPESEREELLWKFDGKSADGNGVRRAAEDVSTKADDSQLWEFDGKNAEGNGIRRAAEDVSTEAEDSRLWEFDGQEAAGSGTRSARTEAAEAADKRKWPPTVSAKTYAAVKTDTPSGGD